MKGVLEAGPPDRRHIDDFSMTALRRVFHGESQSFDHLLDSDQAQTFGRAARRRNHFYDFVERHDQLRPASAGSQYIPRTNNRRGQSALANHRFAQRSHPEIVSHDWRRLRYADINKMGNCNALGRLNRTANRHQIDAIELIRFGRSWMRRADQMNDRIAWSQGSRDRILIERITGHRRRSRGHAAERLLARQHAHAMAARHKKRNEMLADITRAAGNKDVEGSWHA